MEFWCRDAKPFTELADSQARCHPAWHFHFNAAMIALNLLKLEDRLKSIKKERHVISIAS